MNHKISVFLAGFYLKLMFVFFIFSSCVTTNRSQEVQTWPAILQPEFQSCDESEGSANLKILSDGVSKISGQLVWTVQRTSQLDIQINSSFGESIAEIHHSSGGQWSLHPGSFGTIAEAKDSKLLMFEDYELPIRRDELGCIFLGKWPQEWMNSLVVHRKSNGDFESHGVDSYRSFELKFTRSHLNPSSKSSCAVIKWGGFLGFFKKRFEICRSEPQKGSILVVGMFRDYRLEWDFEE